MIKFFPSAKGWTIAVKFYPFDIVRELKKVTGKSYGYDQERWEKWWDSVKDKWQVPKKFTKPWDEQERMY